MRILSVVGCRPQLIKASALSPELLRVGIDEWLIHTGQHYDEELSGVFFSDLDLPPPADNLGIGSGKHGWQTARMLSGLETCLTSENPQLVLVYGDTNSTLAGALAASKLGLPVAHVEAGLRSGNREMPEEINRILTDHLSSLLFCPSQGCVERLRAEGISEGVCNSGDVMLDVLNSQLDRIQGRSRILDRLGLKSGDYVLATVHRAENTRDTSTLRKVISCLEAVDGSVLFPVHPGTAQRLQQDQLELPGNVIASSPLGYLDMLRLVRSARAVLTDSGGLQKEAFWLQVPCVTLRDETEWMETLHEHWNTLAGLDPVRVRAALDRQKPEPLPSPVYGDGTAAPRIAEAIKQHLQGAGR